MFLHLQPQLSRPTSNHFANFACVTSASKSFPHIQLQTTSQMYQNKDFIDRSMSFALIQLQVALALKSSNSNKINQIQDAPSGHPRGWGARHPYLPLPLAPGGAGVPPDFPCAEGSEGLPRAKRGVYSFPMTNTPFVSVEKAVEEIRQGRLIVLVGQTSVCPVLPNASCLRIR